MIAVYNTHLQYLLAPHSRGNNFSLLPPTSAWATVSDCLLNTGLQLTVENQAPN